MRVTVSRNPTLLELVAQLLVPLLIITMIASCTAEPRTVVSEQTGRSEQPTGTPTPPPPSDALEAYGDLENLDPSRQVVTFWHQHTGGREELLLNMVDEFNRINDWNITVLAESQGNCDDLYARNIDGLSANRLPNMATACQNEAATYAALGKLVALDTYVESSRWGYSPKALDDYFPVALAAGYLPQFEATYAWPFYKSTEVMCYNEDWLAELGYEGPPETWDEFAEMACAAVEQPFSGIRSEGAILGYEYSISARRFATFVFSHGGNFINEDGTAYVFNSPESLEALTLVKSLADRGCARSTDRRHGVQSDFSAGRVLFTICTIDQLPHYRKAVDAGAGFKWNVDPPPHSADRDRPRMNIYGTSQVIFKSTPRRQLAAWLYIKWMGEPEQQARWASGTGYYPTRQSVADLMTDYFAENPTYEKAFGFMALDYSIEPPVAGYDKCRLAIEEMLSVAMTEDNPRPQLDTALDQCNEYLREALR